VRRFPAILLLALFSISLIEPALAADDDSKLPACCRRTGQHHCSIAGAASGTLIQAVCAVFPATAAAPAYSKLTGVRPVLVAAVLIFGNSAARPQTERLARNSSSRTHQKRGPPILFS